MSAFLLGFFSATLGFILPELIALLIQTGRIVPLGLNISCAVGLAGAALFVFIPK